MIYAAELMESLGEHERAKSLLNDVLALPIDPEWEFENLRDRALAQSMLQMTGH
jgi:hypothetical protein